MYNTKLKKINEMVIVKCKRCCKHIFNEESTILNGHSQLYKTMQEDCDINSSNNCLYISLESVPDWIRRTINEKSWTKGRIYCPFCSNRLGSFNLIVPTKCRCNQFTVPPVAISRSKVDVFCI